jgi:hypothetical protein
VTGLQNATGIQGLTGLGLQGVTGLIGITGLRGVTGLTGLTGAQGLTGVQGITGIYVGATGTVSFVMDGGGVSLITGIKGDITLPYNLVFNEYTLLARETGTAWVGLWRSSYASYPPTSAVAMHVGATGPVLNLGVKNQLAGLLWTGAAGDIVRINLDRVTGIQMLSMALDYYKT